MKMLIFETSMMKNFQYDIVTITNQVEKAKKRDDIKEFIEKNRSDKQKLTERNPAIGKDMLAASIFNIADKVFERRIGLDTNKEIKSYIEKRFKEEAASCQLITEERITQINRIFNIISKSWKGEVIAPQELTILNSLLRHADNRLFTFLYFRQYLLTYNVVMTQAGYHEILQIVIELLNVCLEQKDVFVARKIVNLTFSFYYIKDDLKNYLHYGLNEAKIFAQLDYWKGSAFESIQ